MSAHTTTPSPSARSATRVQNRTAQRSLMRRFLARPEVGAMIGAIAVYAFFWTVAPSFRAVDSLSTVLYQASTLGLMALPVGLLMIGGEFDLSAGVAVITSSLTASMFAYQLSMNVWMGVIAALLVSLAVGFFNGYVLVKTKLPSFLVTLGSFLMLQGLNLAITKIFTGNVATNDISDMQGFNSAKAVFASDITIVGISMKVTVLWWLLFVAIATWVLLRAKFGNWVFAVGGQNESARAVGVPVSVTKIVLFMLVGLGAWFVGMHQLFEYNTVQSGEGIGNELLYIVAAVIGGCLLTGGYGSAIGPAFGAFIFGMVTQGIVFAGWNPDWFKFFLGVMLLGAMLLNTWVRRQASRR
ncbi:ABC transporter permease [Streptomyces sp. 110]|uniref:Xylose transport system permease protein XylH n=1 Tax=Streptomyces endocoffeicus TaxID=2898945 RepID=A0ABS1PFN3_9ACTN|nr:ABC transporter permease [Streptomyces endocoffeicus]MBL1110985.1 ABC transporter permease [Streptomyces endocoffeicus]